MGDDNAAWAQTLAENCMWEEKCGVFAALLYGDTGEAWTCSPEAKWDKVDNQQTYSKSIMHFDTTKNETYEKDTEIWEPQGLKYLLDQGKSSPEWGLWLGGKQYKVLRASEDGEGDDQIVFYVLKTEKAGATVAHYKGDTKKSIGCFWSEEEGQAKGEPCNLTCIAAAREVLAQL
jgi:hypothetical protein